MSVTDELRRMLDERGVEHDDAYDITLWTGVDGRAYTAVEMVPLSKKPSKKLMVRQILTPAQAVEATLGRGMLTADDVRDLIERHSDASGGNGRDFHNGAYVAIADELNATLGGDNSDTVKHLMKLQGGHYSWPMLYEAVTGDPFDYDCPPSKSEEVFIEKLISIVGGRKVVDE